MRVLLFGGSGMLGHDLCTTAPPGVDVVAPPSAEVDIADRDAVDWAVRTHEPDWVINAAAYTGVDAAERNLSRAFRVNAEGPRYLVASCAARDIRLVHFSSDYVFGGDASRPRREYEPTGPLNVYGRSKLAGELAVLDADAKGLVIRTSWLFGTHGRSFPRTMLERARRREATRVVNDQVGRPTWTLDLAAITWELVARQAAGIVHATASGAPTTWYEIARRVFAHAGVPGLLSPCSSADFAVPAARPAWSVLDLERVTRLIGRRPPDWEESLSDFVKRLARESSR